MTRIQLDSGYVEVNKDVNFPITLAFADITANGSRTGGYSKVIDIDGNTENNERVIGRAFDVDLTNDNFDRNKKTTCTVIQNETEVFTGFIQLVEVVRVNKGERSNAKKVTYKIAVFDEVANFFLAMGDKELTDLDFTDLEHTFNRDNVIASWDNTTGYIYPQYAKDDNVYTLRDFKPAIFELTYFERIFKTNGYSFTFAQANNDDIRLNKRFIPFNGKEGDGDVSEILKEQFTVKGEDVALNFEMLNDGSLNFLAGMLHTIDYTSPTRLRALTTGAGAKMQLDSIFQDEQSQYNTTTHIFKNKAGNGRTFNYLTSYDYIVDVRAIDEDLNVIAWRARRRNNGRCEVYLTLIAQSLTDLNKRVIIDAGSPIRTFLGTESNVEFATGYQSLATGSNSSTANLGVFNDDEEFDVRAVVMGRYYQADGSLVTNEIIILASSLATDGYNQLLPVVFNESATTDGVKLEFDVQISNLQFKATPDIQEFVAGGTMSPNLFVPKKIKQSDLISSLAKSYNLIFVPDLENENNIIIKTRDKYYDDGEEWDWTDKIDEGQDSNITFLNNTTNREQRYRYKSDKDSLNNAYQEEFNITYGETQIRLDNEYATGQNVRELIYSPTPNLVSGLGHTLPSIDGASPDNNVRVLLNHGKKTTSSYPFYNDILPTEANLGYTTNYLSSSMFDDDRTPNFAILYDAPKALFHNIQQGQTSNYLYNLHHQRELTTINKGKMLSAYFNLTESDFQKLSKKLDYKIFIRDNGWFYISKIHNYNGSVRTLTKVDLVTADDNSRIKYRIPRKPKPLGTLKPNRDYFGKVTANTNVIISDKTSDVKGRYNLVVGKDVRVLGDRNKVLSDDVVVMGNNNTINTGLNSVKVLGDSTTPTEIGTFIGGDNIAKDGVVIYKASITQTGTGAPTVNILKNKLGSLTWTRISAGIYSGIHDADYAYKPETEVLITNYDADNIAVAYYEITDDTIKIKTGVDGVLKGAGKSYITIIEH